MSNGTAISQDQSSHLGLKFDTASTTNPNLITPQYTTGGSQSPITIENLNFTFADSQDFKGEADGTTNTTYNITLGIQKDIKEVLLKGNGRETKRVGRGGWHYEGRFG